MECFFYSSKHYEQALFEKLNSTQQHNLVFSSAHLNEETAILAKDCSAICCFVNDTINAQVLSMLKEYGVGVVLLRSAGYNHVDLKAATKLGIKVARVPAYSPYAVAEHAVGIILTLNRKLHRSYSRVREGNFLLDNLLGFDLYQKNVGIIGTGNIGSKFAAIMKGFGCKVIANDLVESEDCKALGVNYVSLDELYQQADIISLHCPLTKLTHHLIDSEALDKMKSNVMLINTSRGAIIDTKAVIRALKENHIGYLGIDVYEEEEQLFFEDHSNYVIQDDVFARLLTFPNVFITAHQAFFTQEALNNIVSVTLENLSWFEESPSSNNLNFLV